MFVTPCYAFLLRFDYAALLLRREATATLLPALSALVCPRQLLCAVVLYRRAMTLCCCCLFVYCPLLFYARHHPCRAMFAAAAIALTRYAPRVYTMAYVTSRHALLMRLRCRALYAATALFG